MKKVTLGILLMSSVIFGQSVAYDTNCASCHGVKGNESLAGNPLIVGLSEAKTSQMLKDYKSGKLKGDTMNGIAAGLSDADITSISKFVGTFK